MSLDDIWNEETEEKAVSEESPEPPKNSESESVPIPEKEDESKEVVEQETPAPSKVEDADDWFSPAVDESTVDEPVVDEPTDEESAEVKSAEDQPIEEEPVKKKVDEESPGDEAEVAETPEAGATTEVEDEWFVPAPEEPISEEVPSEVSKDVGAFVGVEAAPIVCQAVSAEVMKEQMRQFQRLKAGLLDSSDIVTIKNRPFIKRSGWRKMGLAFNLSDDIVKEIRDDFEGGFRWRMWVKVTAPNGRSVIGVGGCSSEERDFAHLEHDVYSICHTRAKNRALSDMIGSGQVSWEELRSFDS